MAEQVKKVVLAYSGGLDTSIILKWLLEEYKCEVIAFAADLGQGDDLETVRQRPWIREPVRSLSKTCGKNSFGIMSSQPSGPMPSMRDTTFWVPLSLVLSSPKGR